ncbi:MAG: chitobiase/beta-hexosaminidase C-terminal domain-containing protein [Rhodothermia bacterium]|nr:chitobiase/beta-hexosaminidase C-terminal domain-containing protein [Rhodothermia bacterium]
MLKYIFFFFLFTGTAYTQDLTPDFQVHTRLSFYMNETEGQLMLVFPDTSIKVQTVSVVADGRVLSKGLQRIRPDLWLVNISLIGAINGTTELNTTITLTNRHRFSKKATLIKLPFEPNAVQIDRLTGGLWSDGLPLFPFGFYAYSPLQPTLPEEEAVKGFNMISPYQKIEAGTRAERKAYLDRAAQLGMKVHFNLLSVAGGGGVSQEENGKPNSVAEKRALLRAEIEAFKKHPALLGWYISDEPSAVNIPPAPLEELYRFIKSIDPYHPITIVFNEVNNPTLYSGAMDIVMADPYPIPNQPIAQVQTFTEKLVRGFRYQKPVWIVPQAFGGGEWWQREPTRQEIRAMTYLALIHGATGIQYFIRHGLNGFPKSTDVWNEAGAVAREVMEMTPFLLSDLPAAEVATNDPNLVIRTARYDGSWLVMLVNLENQPKTFSIRIPEIVWDGKAKVLFANREVNYQNAVLSDMVDAYGTRVYLLPVSEKREKVGLHPGNLTMDASFEAATNPATPDAVYAQVGLERGSPYFLDTRTSLHGKKSLRVTTPVAEKGTTFQFFPVRLERGQSYLLSLWAKGDRQTSLNGAFRLGLGELLQNFSLTSDWQKYTMPIRLPEGDVRFVRSSASLSLLSAGTAWFDLVQLHPDPQIIPVPTPEPGGMRLQVLSVLDQQKIVFTTDGSIPTASSPHYTTPIPVTQSMTLRAGVLINNLLVSETKKSITVHKGFMQSVTYKTPFNAQFPGSGQTALVDGEHAQTLVQDARWQGFLGDDLEVTVDLGAIQGIEGIGINFLQDEGNWVFLPQFVSYALSSDGQQFIELPTLSHLDAEDNPKSVSQIPFQVALKTQARYIRVRAKNIGTCPAGHPGAGEKAWLFADEIEVY